MVEAVNDDAYLLHPVGRVASSLTDAASAPRQGDEGAPTAWLVFDPQVERALRDLRVGTEMLVLTWLDRARRDVLAGAPARRREPAGDRGVQHPLTAPAQPDRAAPGAGPGGGRAARRGRPTWRPSTAPRSWTSNRCWARPTNAEPVDRHVSPSLRRPQGVSGRGPATPAGAGPPRRSSCRRRDRCARPSPAGRVSRRSRIDRTMVSKSLYERPVAPGPPAKSVSPVNTAPSSGAWKRTRRGVPGGVQHPQGGAGHLDRSARRAARRPGGRCGWTMSQSTRSAGCSSTGAPVASASSGATRTWSSWAWVAGSPGPAGRRPGRGSPSTSCGASMTTHSRSSPITQTLLSTSKVCPSRENVPEVTAWSIAGGHQEHHHRAEHVAVRASGRTRPRPRRARSPR